MRCVNLDWLEIYCLESNDRYPCNADYFRRQGYYVSEREYGTRQYHEMFTLVDEDNNPLIEIRRNPKSGESDFCGFVPQSCHIRIPNWRLYQKGIIDWLREFIILHDYIYKRIFRIDICYDFEYFDSGDQPARFARRYVERKFRKINQCHLAVHADDTWSDFAWESLSWGSQTSMVSTKLYNKSKELKSLKNDKPYIKTAWMFAGLIDNPVSMTKRRRDGELYEPEIWRLEFSLKSAADNWLVIEDQSGKKVKKRAVRHTLSLFDSPDKIWQRFQDLAFHYFHFKYREYKDEEKAVARIALNDEAPVRDKELKRKDRCRDKVLFYWDRDHEFMQVKQVPPPSKPSRDDDVLLKRLHMLKNKSGDMNIRKACDAIIEALEKEEARRLTPNHLFKETQLLQAVIRSKIGGDVRSSLEIMEELKELIFKGEIF